MSILICGGAGYIGSHTNKLLSREGYDTVVFDNLVYGHKDSVKWGNLIIGDLSDNESLEKVFIENKIDAVFHFAAYAYVGESVENPAKYYINNLVNTINLLEVMRKYNCDKIIFSSTCATYGEPNQIPIIEEMPQNPINPYGKTKLMVEQIFKDYNKAYGLKYVALRYFNAAGADPECEIGEKHDPETHIIPLLLDVASGRTSDIKIFGTDYPTKDGSCIRDYIHVWDLAKAHLLAYEYLEKGNQSGFFNLGNQKGTSVLEVIESVKKVTGKDFNVTYAPRRAGDPPVLVGCSKRAEEVLGWKPEFTDIDVIVRHAWEWCCKQ